ncbi:thioredoxin family protein [Massilia sp. DJPM01]|uniref:thioredoxin family protein n=1 Tax=Massilia sp. DJPM01 TaxID=3024404 RepID=UPI00259ED9F5|nr:thioredoxin family protein [Massilia sp. DJPM01]MDM5181404.1 thioredoxin family protein [Massilia sp. DJPM01]
MSARFDPWTDAAVIAARLSVPTSRLVLIIGAENWCQSCRTLRPVFESLAAHQANLKDIWLWLDLEEHAEFVDDFIPEDLPLLLSYSGRDLTHAVIVSDLTVAALEDLLSQSERIDQTIPPNIRTRLMTVDWAL